MTDTQHEKDYWMFSIRFCFILFFYQMVFTRVAIILAMVDVWTVFFRLFSVFLRWGILHGLALVALCTDYKDLQWDPSAPSSGSVTLSSSISPHPLFFSSPPAALLPSAEHRYLFRNLSVEIILHLRRSLSTHNYHGQSCRTGLNSAGTLMTLLTARPSVFWR